MSGVKVPVSLEPHAIGRLWGSACLYLCASLTCGVIPGVSTAGPGISNLRAILALMGTFILHQTVYGGQRSSEALVYSFAASGAAIFLTFMYASSTSPLTQVAALAVVVFPLFIAALLNHLSFPLAFESWKPRLLSGTVTAMAIAACAEGMWVCASPASATLSLAVGINGADASGAISGILLVGFGAMTLHSGLSDPKASQALSCAAACAALASAVGTAFSRFKAHDFILQAVFSAIAVAAWTENELTKPNHIKIAIS
jgi:hypothetical protein